MCPTRASVTLQPMQRRPQPRPPQRPTPRTPGWIAKRSSRAARRRRATRLPPGRTASQVAWIGLLLDTAGGERRALPLAREAAAPFSPAHLQQ